MLRPAPLLSVLRVVAGLALSTGVAAAEGLSEILLGHPDPGIAAHYADHAMEVLQLVTQATGNSDTQSRLDALGALDRAHPQAAYQAAVQLVTDPDDAVAMSALVFVQRGIVMSDHPMSEASQDPRVAWVMARHLQGRVALRAALVDERPHIRGPAAMTLASLSDEESLAAIEAGVVAGRFAPEEALSLLSLAEPAMAAPRIWPLVHSDTLAHRDLALDYLASEPVARARVRAELFQAPDVATPLRVAAALALAEYDPGFSSYALSVAAAPDVPPALYATTVGVWLDQGVASDAAPARLLSRDLEALAKDNKKLLKKDPELSAQLDALYTRLEALERPQGE